MLNDEALAKHEMVSNKQRQNFVVLIISQTLNHVTDTYVD